jgi:hypothetical protein
LARRCSPARTGRAGASPARRRRVASLQRGVAVDEPAMGADEAEGEALSASEPRGAGEPDLRAGLDAVGNSLCQLRRSGVMLAHCAPPAAVSGGKGISTGRPPAAPRESPAKDFSALTTAERDRAIGIGRCSGRADTRDGPPAAARGRCRPARAACSVGHAGRAFRLRPRRARPVHGARHRPIAACSAARAKAGAGGASRAVVGPFLSLAALSLDVSRPFDGNVRDEVLALGVSSTEVAAVGLVGLAGGSAVLALGALTGSLVVAALAGPPALGFLAGAWSRRCGRRARQALHPGSAAALGRRPGRQDAPAAPAGGRGRACRARR